MPKRKHRTFSREFKLKAIGWISVTVHLIDK